MIWSRLTQVSWMKENMKFSSFWNFSWILWWGFKQIWLRRQQFYPSLTILVYIFLYFTYLYNHENLIKFLNHSLRIWVAQNLFSWNLLQVNANWSISFDLLFYELKHVTYIFIFYIIYLLTFPLGCSVLIYIATADCVRVAPDGCSSDQP